MRTGQRLKRKEKVICSYKKVISLIRVQLLTHTATTQQVPLQWQVPPELAACQQPRPAAPEPLATLAAAGPVVGVLPPDEEEWR